MSVDRQPGGHSGQILAVGADSFADRLGVLPGDELLTINDRPLRDAIDVQYYGSESPLRLCVRRGDETLLFDGERRYGEPLGLDFQELLFDRIRRCNNRCDFCFVAQMPHGLRSSLYVKDDDYRLSFLSGSYVTLTNLTEADWHRIQLQHLSPLYVSVHATDTGLRRQLLRNPDAPDVLDQLRRLSAMGIVTHTQIVVQPDVNDGWHLDRTVGDLAQLYPAVRSVSIVPVGLTKYHRFDCRLPTYAEKREVLERVAEWQSRFREALGVTFAYLSDEWYLSLDLPVPPALHYDDLDLTENGVGLVRHFLDVRRKEVRRFLSAVDFPLLVTGTLFAPVLRAAIAGSGAEVVPVVNRFFGDSVTVSGLLIAGDVISALQHQGGGGPVALPPAMFNGPDGRSLDGMRSADVERALGRPVIAGLKDQ